MRSSGLRSLFPNSLALLCEPQLVHPAMDGRPRLQEGSFQIGLVVLLSVVVRHCPRSIPWAQYATAEKRFGIRSSLAMVSR